jgi:predicted PurR-regulated permease PerM
VDTLELSDRSASESEALVESAVAGQLAELGARRPGRPFNRRSPFYMGFLAALGALIAYGLVQAVVQLADVFTLIVVALFLSLGLEPLVARLVDAGLTRGWAVLVVATGVLTAFALVGWLLVPTVIDEVTRVVGAAPGYVDRLSNSDLVEHLNSRFHLTTRLENSLRNSLSERRVMTVFGGILGAGRAVVDNALSAFTVLVLTLYFLATMPQAKAAAYRLVPSSRRPRFVYLAEEMSHRVSAYIFGQVCVAALNAVLTYVVLKVLGMPFPLLLATFVGLLALVPIVGTLVGGIIVTLVGLSDGWQTALVVLAYYIAYHVFEAYVLTPRIMRRVIEMPPAVTIVAVVAGGTLLGILGALLAIPIAASLLVLYEQVAVPHQQRS